MQVMVSDKLLLNFFTRSRDKRQGMDEYIEDLWQQLGQRIEAEPDFKVTIEDKLGLSRYVIKKAIEEYGADKTVVAWTGGKDSTLILWMVRQLVKEEKWAMPSCVFIDEGEVFEEIDEFVARYTKK